MEVRFFPALLLLGTVASQPAIAAPYASPAEVPLYQVVIIDGDSPPSWRARHIDDPIRCRLDPADMKEMQRVAFLQSTQGYSVVTTEYDKERRSFDDSPYMRPYSEIKRRLAFEPAAPKLGYPLIGVLEDRADDGRVHDLEFILDHPRFGVMRISERNLDGYPSEHTLYAYIPEPNIEIDGLPAVLTVTRVEGGSGGFSSIYLLSKKRSMSIWVEIPVARDAGEYTALMELAERFVVASGGSEELGSIDYPEGRIAPPRP